MSMKAKEITWKESESGCWICTSHKITRTGYVRFRLDGKKTLIHRYMYEQKYGKILNNLHACHICDVRNCINPDHIFLGTDKDNNLDMVKKHRNNNVKGENHYASKLTESQVREIKFNYKKIPQKDLASKYNISQSLVSIIQLKKRWKHIED